MHSVGLVARIIVIPFRLHTTPMLLLHIYTPIPILRVTRTCRPRCPRCRLVDVVWARVPVRALVPVLARPFCVPLERCE